MPADRVVLKPTVVQHQAKALIAHFDDPSFARCATKALTNLLGLKTAPVAWTFRDGQLTIQSATRPQTYVCDGAQCPCEARPTAKNPTGWCWHLALWHLIHAVATITDPFHRRVR